MHEEVVGDVQVRGVRAAGVVNPVLPATVILHHPLPTLHEVTQIWTITLLAAKHPNKSLIPGILNQNKTWLRNRIPNNSCTLWGVL